MSLRRQGGKSRAGSHGKIWRYSVSVQRSIVFPWLEEDASSGENAALTSQLAAIQAQVKQLTQDGEQREQTIDELRTTLLKTQHEVAQAQEDLTRTSHELQLQTVVSKDLQMELDQTKTVHKHAVAQLESELVEKLSEKDNELEKRLARMREDFGREKEELEMQLTTSADELAQLRLKNVQLGAQENISKMLLTREKEQTAKLEREREESECKHAKELQEMEAAMMKRRETIRDEREVQTTPLEKQEDTLRTEMAFLSENITAELRRVAAELCNEKLHFVNQNERLDEQRAEITRLKVKLIRFKCCNLRTYEVFYCVAICALLVYENAAHGG